MAHEPKPFKKEAISVAFMVEQLTTTVGVTIEQVNEADPHEQQVVESNLHRPGLVLSGYTELFQHHRVQILGNTETQFLRHMATPKRRRAFETLLGFPIPCIILTDDNRLHPELVALADTRGVPVYCTSLPSTHFMSVLRDFLNDQFALQLTIHGSLVDVYGIGLLLMGKSGIGKSEVALDLVERGHRLVADDVVVVTKKEEQVLMGAGTDLVQHFMEIRGLGLIDIRAMFGIRAIRNTKKVEVVVELQRWRDDHMYERTGLDQLVTEVIGLNIPRVIIPITPGKNLTVISEVIAMNMLLKMNGIDAAKQFNDKLIELMRNKNQQNSFTRVSAEVYE